jgi:hypothetical protein
MFLAADRGHVRRNNDQSVDSRGRFFAEWLESLGHTKQSASTMTNDQLIDTLGAYLESVKTGNNLQKMRLTGQSLRNYITAAAMCMSLLTGVMPQYYDQTTMSHKRIFLHPYLHERIVQRSIWSKPEQLKEPFTYRMLADHARILRTTPGEHRYSFLGLDYAVWDWMRIGVFTGSRLAEYAQSNLRATQRYQTIPNNEDSGQWAGMALAFTQDDFQFFDHATCLVPKETLLSVHKKKGIHMVHLRFRFDKSRTNFSLRKFTTTDDMILDPVDAAVSILRRAEILGVPCQDPVGVYSKKGDTEFSFIRDYNITPIMRQMCVRAYPDPAHYLRLHIHRLVPHSNRVTAAVCLKMGGSPDEEIAFRLRWNVASVPTYLRECFQEVGPVMLHTLQGAFKTS